MPEDRPQSHPDEAAGTGAAGEDSKPGPGDSPVLSARDLQENASEEPLEAEPGSDADQANEVPHVG